MEAFLCAAAARLHRHGTPAQRIEEELVAAGAAQGVVVQVFATPTSVELAFGDGPQRNHLFRGDAGEAELGRLVDFHRVLGAVARGELRPDAGSSALDAVAAGPPPYGPWATVFAFGLASAGAARFLSGTLPDVLISLGLGLALGVGIHSCTSRPGLARVFAPLAAFFAALVSTVAAAFIPGVHDAITTLAALIVLVPGLSLTLAMSELATRHLVSGTARLAGALSGFVTMAFGVAVARVLGAALVGGVSAHLDGGTWLGVGLEALGSASLDGLGAIGLGSVDWQAPLGERSRMLALVLAPVGFCVLFQARPADAPAIVLSGVLGAELARVSGAEWGPEIGAFVGALAVGLSARAYGRFARVPAVVLSLPGLLLLVPGSVGFHSVTLFLAHDPSAGVEAVFRMLVVAVALVAGVLAANTVAPSQLVYSEGAGPDDTTRAQGAPGLRAALAHGLAHGGARLLSWVGGRWPRADRRRDRAGG